MIIIISFCNFVSGYLIIIKMTQVVLTVKNSKLPFFLELIRNFDFVQVEDTIYVEPTNNEIIENIKEGLKEVQLIEQGKQEGTLFQDFINEL